MPSRVVAVGTTAVKLLDVKNDRVQYIIQNLDESTEIYMTDDNGVTTSTGRRLDPLEMENGVVLFDPAAIRGPLYAIAASTVNVYVNEWTGKLKFKGGR